MQLILAPKMGNPRPVVTFHPGLEIFASKFLDERRQQKWRDYRQALVRRERIDRGTNFRKGLDPFGKNGANIQCFKFRCYNKSLL
jgi:hypothetical protein